jgi:hypothetical protein
MQMSARYLLKLRRKAKRLGIVGSGECRVQKRGGALGTQVEEEAGGEWRRRAPRARKISRR